MSEQEPIRIDVINVLGQTVISRTVQPAGIRHHEELDLGYNPNGIYFVKVSTNAGEMTKRIVKQ